MKVKCINTDLCETLSVNREYSVIEEGENYYVVIDNIMDELTCKKEQFIVVQDGDLVKKAKATINELNYQLTSECADIKDFTIRKNNKGEIKEIIIKLKY
ncbi:MAG: hypothetical protein Q8936_01465 [Bacillota bacterium]|nr:hypothetical protein [Bacillota bacterium]